MSARLRAVPSRANARAVWDAAVAKAGDRMQELTARFASGALTEAEYVLEMRALVKAMHMGALAAGSGGRRRVTSRDLARLGPLLRDEYGHIARKVGRMQAGERPVEHEVRTVRGYADHALLTYRNAAVRRGAPKRLTHARWVLHAGENCEGCERQNARGVQPRTAFPPLGSQPCGSHCKCEIVLQEGTG